MMVWTALVTLVFKAWALFQPAPQKIRSISTCVSTGPPLSTTVRDPALLHRTVGTVRLSRGSRTGLRRAFCEGRCRGKEARSHCQDSAKSMMVGLLECPRAGQG